MNNGEIKTLFDLLGAYQVEIPIVQRDYVQGRLDEHSTMVRKNLLEDMKLAISQVTEPLDLNFVYGKEKQKKFIPIDGQQRLTTLFLLHLYAFCEDDTKTDLLKNFTYKTRVSSRDFLTCLTENRRSVFTSNLSPSAEIADSEWFTTGWKNDPTIQSVLVMLDSIKLNFGEMTSLPDALTNQDAGPILFHFLEMKDLGMEDDLYIKLNARGKPLTAFENFKARLNGRMKKTGLSFAREFELLMDTDWTDLFWSQGKENFDKAYLAFFGTLLMNSNIIENDAGWSDSFEFDKIDKRIFETAFYTLNYLCKSDDAVARKIVFSGIADNRTYPDRVMFHAVTTFLLMSKGQGDALLASWLRIIGNLTRNSTIDQARNYRPAIEGINRISDHWNRLLKFFCERGAISGFSTEQILEEYIKANIICNDTAFAESIFKAEQHPYFGGQIRSALYLAKDNDDAYSKTSFDTYWSKISQLFDANKPKNGILLRRALLVLGDFTLGVSSFKTLCVDDPDEGASTPSLKRLFSNGGEIVAKLLDLLDESTDPEPQLQKLVDNSTVLKTDWRFCFIEFPSLFSLMSSSHLRLREVDNEMIIVPGKWSNGYNYDLFLAALHESLKKAGINSEHELYLGRDAERNLLVKKKRVRFGKGKFSVEDNKGNIILNTSSNDPISEATNFFQGT